MMIQEYLSDLKKVQLKSGEDFSAEMAQTAEVWSNAACKGYAVKAMQNVGLDDETIREVVEELSCCFDEISVDEAAAIFERKTFSRSRTKKSNRFKQDILGNAAMKKETVDNNE